MSNPLTEVLPPAARKVLYAILALAGIILTAVQVGYVAADLDQPTWLLVALAVYPVLGAGLGATAYSNVKARQRSPA